MIKIRMSRAVKRGSAYCWAIALPLLSAAGASAQMAIPGEFEVTPVGAASYTVPIQVPPGIEGVEPKLALTYSSRAGNGPLGVGWSLAGLPSIGRCSRTSPQDGAKGSVSYNSDDRFCLDGKRLMVISGSYGAAGSAYRTEIDSFSNVTASGSAGSGPQSFVVKTKDGLTMEFGNTTDSRLSVVGLATVRLWALNKISDSKGNYLSITYTQPIAGSLYPDRIDYSGNSVTGLATTNSVHFGYSATRPDPLSGYQGGYPFQTNLTLATITTKTNGSTVLVYTNNYEVGSGGRSRIASISLCSPTGLCAANTSIAYGGVTPPGFASILPVSTTANLGPTVHWYPIDMNGDGRTDLLQLGPTSPPPPGGTLWSWNVDGVYASWMSNGDGAFNVTRHVNSADKDTCYCYGPWKMLDVNGDGLADLIHLTANNGDVRVWKSNGDGTFKTTRITTAADPNFLGGWHVLDVDGDGLADLVHMTTTAGDMRVWKSNGDGTFAITQFTNSIDTGLTTGTWQVLDVDGDGLADLVHMTTNAGDMRVWRSNGNGTFTISKFTNSIDTALTEGQWQQLDVNGDGLTDLVHIATTTGEVRVWTSKGDGAFAISKFTNTTDTALTNGSWQVLDVNGDGLADLLHTPASMAGGRYWTWESKGDGTFKVTTLTQAVDGGQVDPACGNVDCSMVKAGDFLGSGSPGFVRLSPATVKYAWVLGVSPRNVATAISDGIGGTTSWTLSALPSMLARGTYVKDLPSDSVALTVTSAIPVVENVRVNAGWVHDPSNMSADRLTKYSYGSARVERNGRGFVGFNWVQTKDSATGLTSQRRFRQDFPYTGAIAMTAMGNGGVWSNLRRTTTSYGCTMLDGGATCTVAPGNRYFVYPAQMDSYAWDLDGTPLPRTRIVNADPDLYGNIGTSSTYVLNPDGSATDYSKIVSNTYFNDPTNWYIGRLVKSVVTSTGPTVAPPVTPGSGNLPPAPNPTLPPASMAALMSILQLLLSDD